MRTVLIMMLVVAVLMATAVWAQEVIVNKKKLERATFAGGCFWCMQPFFDRTKGVKETMVGYMGGDTKDPTYEEVSQGDTGHAEVIQITYDPAEVAYEKLLNIFWRNIDPTQKNAQFVDYGTQYRSAVFYHNDEQRQIAEASKKELAASGRFDSPIMTEIVQASVFYPAEEYHQKYYQKSSMRYEMYSENTGRKEFKKRYWGRDAE